MNDTLESGNIYRDGYYAGDKSKPSVHLQLQQKNLAR